MNINAKGKNQNLRPQVVIQTKRHAYNTDNISIELSKEINDYVFSVQVF